MIKAVVKTNKDGGYIVECNEKHANSIEALTLIDSLIWKIQEHSELSFRQVIKLIKDARKCCEWENVEDDNIDNTNK